MAVRISKTAIIVVSLSTQLHDLIKEKSALRGESASSWMRECVRIRLEQDGEEIPYMGFARKILDVPRADQSNMFRSFLEGETVKSIAERTGLTRTQVGSIIQRHKKLNHLQGQYTSKADLYADIVQRHLDDPFFALTESERRIAEAFVRTKNYVDASIDLGLTRQRVEQVVFALTREYRKHSRRQDRVA